MTDPQAARITENIKAAMDAAGVTTAALAERIGRLRGRRVSPMWVSRRVPRGMTVTRPIPLIRPEVTDVITDDLRDIAEALGTTAEALIGADDEPATEAAAGRLDRADNQPERNLRNHE